MTNEKVEQDMAVVKAYADVHGKNLVESYLCETIDRSMLRRTMRDRLGERFGELESLPPISPKDEIDRHFAAIQYAESAINDIAAKVIPEFHFLDYRVSNFWDCDASPIGKCLWVLDKEGQFNVSCHCRYCGGPVERK